ncbi:hypothetical protein ABMC89_06385 [Sulfitobacter sp. HNIBRBA3233]|uniref:hypothetical protein n=1 Tax=Sulfitobacter marinivivus TaxID=3158558 RepID=UPI0032DF77A3
MIRMFAAVVALCAATPLAAQSAKETDCGYQADVVAAVQAARMERVRERQVVDHVAGTAPEWPEKYNAVVPLVTPWVYRMKMKELKSADLGEAWEELCLQQ